MNRNKLLFLLALCFSQSAFSQKEDIFLVYKQKYPDEPAVFVSRQETMNLSVVNDSLKVYSDVSEEMIHLREQTESLGKKRVYGSHFSRVENIRARTLLWDKSRYRQMEVSEFKRNSDQGEGIFYDDSYYYSVNFPSVGLRNRTQLEYREVVKEPRFISGFVFNSYLPVGTATYTVKAAKGINIRYEVVNDPENAVRFRRTEKGGLVTYEWTASDLSPYRNEERAPAIRYTAPHVICYVESFTSSKGKVSVLGSVDDLYRWYYTFIKDINRETSEDLRTIVSGLKTGSRDELDFVRKVFYWVQDNIQYIAFEQGMRGFIPHAGSYTCEKRYGDCKDMANLIVNMLALGNVKAYHTWIGTRDLPYRYSQVPTPLVDNHMIAAYIGADGKFYFLDATSDHTPFGFPSSMIQGKEALVSISEKEYRIVEVPSIGKEKNIMTDSLSLTLEGTSLKGEGVGALWGYPKVFAGYRMDRAEKDDVTKYVTKLLGKGSNKFYLDDYQVFNAENRDVPTRIKYSFRIADYHVKTGDEIFVNLNLSKEFYNEVINAETRKNPFENDYRYIRHERIEFHIPAGFVVEYIPEPFSRAEKQFGCTINYSIKGNTVIYEKQFYLDYLLLERSSFDEWNDAIKAISDAYKESIIIGKKK